MAVNTLAELKAVRLNVFRWRCELSTVQKIALALVFAVLTGLAAQVRIPLPWTPVPITGQTFAVVLAGVMMGRWWGGVSMGLYVGLGLLGIPWFNGWSGGISHLAGPTGGYIIGFILAALLVGHFTDKYIKSRSFVGMFGLMLFASAILIYIPGLIQLHLWLSLVQGKDVSVYQTLNMGLLPFVAGDLVKILAAAAIARIITPKEHYNRKIEKI